jgi:hypothetical protein
MPIKWIATFIAVLCLWEPHLDARPCVTYVTVALPFNVPIRGGRIKIYVNDDPALPDQPAFVNADKVVIMARLLIDGGRQMFHALGAVSNYTDERNGTQSWVWTRDVDIVDGRVLVDGTQIQVGTVLATWGLSRVACEELNKK